MTLLNEKVIAVIPAYNEGKTIGRVVRELLPLVSEVVVVNDASKDNTKIEAETAGAFVLTHESNKGYDTTINDGFSEAAKRGATIIMTFDADGEHDAGDVEKILTPIITGKADVVLGQRPLSRHWGEWIFAFYTWTRYGIRDPLCGFKAYKREVYEKFGFFDSLSSIGTELPLRAIKSGCTPAFVPITLHVREEGDSSRFYAMNWHGNMKILKALRRIMSI